MIIYFSGTGNSRYLAEGLSTVLDDEIVNSNEIILKKGKTFHSKKPFVFIAPIYAWRIPRVFDDFIKNNNFEGSNKAYFIVNYGGSSGNAIHYVKKSLKNKNLELLGFAGIAMPENYVALYDVPDDLGAKRIIESAKEKLMDFSYKIKNNEKFEDYNSNIIPHLLSGIGNPIFYKFIVKDKGFNVNDSCISCGICVESCPLDNIVLEEGKPIWQGKCTHCMACISLCPKEAINYKNSTQNKPRYYLKDKF